MRAYAPIVHGRLFEALGRFAIKLVQGWMVGELWMEPVYGKGMQYIFPIEETDRSPLWTMGPFSCPNLQFSLYMNSIYGNGLSSQRFSARCEVK